MKMKTKNNNARILTVTILSLILSTSVFAQRNGNKFYCNRQMLPDLTEEQTEKISELRSNHMAEMTKVKAELKILKAELDQLAIAEQADMKKINSKIDEISALKSKMTKSHYKHRQDVRSLLTEEQRVIFDAKTGKRFGPGHGHRKGHGKHGNGHGPHFGMINS